MKQQRVKCETEFLWGACARARERDREREREGEREWGGGGEGETQRQFLDFNIPVNRVESLGTM